MVDLRAESYKKMRESHGGQAATVVVTPSAPAKSSGGSSTRVDTSGANYDRIITTTTTNGVTSSNVTYAEKEPVIQSAVIDRSGTNYDRTIITTTQKQIGGPDIKSTRILYSPKGELPSSEEGYTISPAQAAYLTSYAQQQAARPTTISPKMKQQTAQPSAGTSILRSSSTTPMDMITGQARISEIEANVRLNNSPFIVMPQIEDTKTKIAYQQHMAVKAQQAPQQKNTLLRDTALAMFGPTITSSLVIGAGRSAKQYAAEKAYLLKQEAKKVSQGEVLAARGAAWGVGELSLLNQKATKQERSLMKTDLAKDIFGKSLQSMSNEIATGSTLNREIDAFQKQVRPELQAAYEKAADERGLTGAERNLFVSQGVSNDMLVSAQNYYMQQGLNLDTARLRAERLASGEKEKEVWSFRPFAKVPLVNRSEKLANFNLRSAIEQVSYLVGGDYDIYMKNVNQNLKAAGLQGEEYRSYKNALSKMYVSRGYGEIAGQTAIEGAGNVLGMGILSGVGKVSKGVQTVGKVAGMTAFSTGLAGAAEGYSGTVFQAQVREQKANTKTALRNAGIGTITAGAFGGALGGFSAAKALGKRGSGVGKLATEVTGYAIDFPYELMGDISSDIGAKGYKLVGGKLAEPALRVIGGKRLPVLTFDVSTSIESVQRGGGGPTQIKNAMPSFADINMYNTNVAQSLAQVQQTQSALSETLFPTKTPSQVTAITSTNPFTNVPSFSNVPSNTNTQVPSNTDNIVGSMPFVNVPAFTDVPTNTNTNTQVNSFVTVPTITPQLRFPPPMPFWPGLDFSGLGGSGGSYAGKKKKYVPELAFGYALLGDLVPTNALRNILPGGRKSTKSKKKKGKGKKKQQQNILPALNLRQILGF